ncbi:tRNA nucleotidyltransferase (CCA-adding enzyme) [Natranaerovirga hydrolytica]|uniref:tRNA nucleotidyltransferase (CCA-adding enzyme) n=1 Tax=Natranaerovirga hydrolytica TaxID=680378 RepID=A0A4R1ML20_9FIRM|nr:CCA tRNA nucleotidyltransferase [Natranaerovirga hydrolytica]TCK93277.1 tRNA nucleotidyltransferase (CCA-adding enzyme) [Natranaerovirga hydrolytica]
MNIKLPQEVEFIIGKLKEKGYKAHAVGGCVRDSILGRSPEDWDITTSAKPEIIKETFNRTIDTGLQHGTVTVLIHKKTFEVTTYRIDGEYLDYRRPTSVEYTEDLVEDLKRRDFTINAMAYNDEDGLVDAFDGIHDLKNKVIKCVGNPVERFNEDALRMLRALRFAAQLDFDIEKKTEEAILMLKKNIESISAERIQVELNKLLISRNPYLFKKLYEVGLLDYIMPEFIPCFHTPQNNPHHQYTVGEHILKSVEIIEPNSVLRWTMLFHDIEKPEKRTTDDKGIDHFYGHAEKSSEVAKKILRRLKFDNKTINYVTRLIYHHDYRYKVNDKSVRKAVYKIGEDIFDWLLKVQEADVKAQSAYKQKEKLETIQTIKTLYEQIKKENQCIHLSDLKVSGKDIINIGVKEGRTIGKTLNYLMEIVLEDPNMNEKEKLIMEAKKYIKNN